MFFNLSNVTTFFYKAEFTLQSVRRFASSGKESAATVYSLGDGEMEETEGETAAALLRAGRGRALALRFTISDSELIIQAHA